MVDNFLSFSYIDIYHFNLWEVSANVRKYFVLFATHFFTNPIKPTAGSDYHSHFNFFLKISTKINQIFQYTFCHSAKHVSQRGPDSVSMTIIQGRLIFFSEFSSLLCRCQFYVRQKKTTKFSIWTSSKLELFLNYIALLNV